MARMRSSIVFAASFRMAILPLLPDAAMAILLRQGLGLPSGLSPPRRTPTPVGEDRLRGVVAGRAGDAAAGMRAGAAVIEPGQRATIVGVAEHGPCPGPQIVRHGCVGNVDDGET